MLITLNDPSLATDLCAHFRRSGFRAESVGGAMIEVTTRYAAKPYEERREIELHLRIWQVMNPTTETVVR